MYLFTAAVAIGLLAGGPMQSSELPPDDGLPRVLILGDSISIGYTDAVRQLLAGEARVLRPLLDNGRPENCAGTNRGVRELSRWLKQDTGRWDVIHFNFGLHDIKRVDPQSGTNSNDPLDPRQASPERYEAQLRQIVAQLKQTGAKLIFATTTPVPPGGVRPHRDVDDPKRYNDIALKIMRAGDVAVSDLYAFALPRLDDIQQPVNVHFTKAGSQALAEIVAKQIRRQLPANRVPD